ncbi:hypothetical protein [Croceibacterium selenioxidans]|uniref:hypothetical protein n=1 Tax=Croceibacterium selenioxidans TaxID=2838833 RepID=UPI002032244F|nr:hypothetical protein [Croceibacterium selenioxidans]
MTVKALSAALLFGASCGIPGVTFAQSASTAPAPVPATADATYADIADLVQASGLVVLVNVKNQAVVEPARAQGLAPGHARLYLQAQTEALLSGRAAVGESLVYLVDVPLLPNGKAPKLKKQRFIVFAQPVAGRPGELQLADSSAQLAATPAMEQKVRAVIAQFASPDVPPKVTGIREAMSVAGNLAGESETQLFLDTATGSPVSLSVVRRPGMQPEWGVSWSEIVDQSARAPQAETAEWYRLACFLPYRLPASALLQNDGPSRNRADADYRFIMEQLGACPRNRG